MLVIGSLWYVPLQAASLIDIYREALEHDAQYGAERAAYIAAQEKLPQGRAGLLPSINATGTGQNQYIDTNLGPEVLIKNRGVVISATQPLIRIENFIIYEQSKKEVAQADARFVLAAQDLILRVAQAYFDTLVAQVNVEVMETQKKAISEQLEQAKRNFEVGVATIVDTHEAQARYDLTVSQEIAARNALEISKRTLQGIINRFPDYLASTSIDKIVSDSLTLPYDSMEEWVTLAEQKNFSLRIQQIAYEMAEQEIKKAKAGHYPTLDLVAQYSNQQGVGGAITGRGIDLESKSVGLQLNVPIFQGFSTQSRVRETLANRDKIRQELENTRRTVGLQVRQHYLNVTNGIAQVKALKQALTSSRSQLDSTILGQEVGVRTEIDVLNAQQQYFSARRDLAQAYYNYLLSRLRLKAEVGELDEEELKEINALL
ncbi:MAG TPA: channel protein TolC [Nitrosomonas nitrosa]|jgi:outer membrane protein|nr:TolC family outer membrane protein [Nitrosomonas nitrosa]MCO6434852.1 TolC family outer membrane protein [Nitrosomonas nitrosa]PTQ93406.1 outer membrane protein [Nitrosomonas nitrosa]SFM17006.1 outer membrane protein [Nitrosomonas nitrosa]HBZ30039.1 channel protein TolC [Nitrosomonas nitrosa]HNP51011.1 TolC family outer membrane protein [Nitrosomonas nitrosa]